MNSTAKVISSTVNFGTIDGKTMADLSDLRDKINGFTGDTGIQAKLSADKQTLDLRSPDGYDILSMILICLWHHLQPLYLVLLIILISIGAATNGNFYGSLSTWISCWRCHKMY